MLHEAWDSALLRASLDAFEGRYDEVELAQKVNIDQVKHEAMALIQQKREEKKFFCKRPNEASLTIAVDLRVCRWRGLRNRDGGL